LIFVLHIIYLFFNIKCIYYFTLPLIINFYLYLYNKLFLKFCILYLFKNFVRPSALLFFDSMYSSSTFLYLVNFLILWYLMSMYFDLGFIAYFWRYILLLDCQYRFLYILFDPLFLLKWFYTIKLVSHIHTVHNIQLLG